MTKTTGGEKKERIKKKKSNSRRPLMSRKCARGHHAAGPDCGAEGARKAEKRRCRGGNASRTARAPDRHHCYRAPQHATAVAVYAATTVYSGRGTLSSGGANTVLKMFIKTKKNYYHYDDDSHVRNSVDNTMTMAMMTMMSLRRRRA